MPTDSYVYTYYMQCVCAYLAFKHDRTCTIKVVPSLRVYQLSHFSGTITREVSH
jgi:hypothetical protein